MEASCYKAFLVFCLFLFQTTQSGSDWYYENIAVGKPSIQIDTSGKLAASRANDGNPSGNLLDDSCSQTKSQSDTWWMVDLLSLNYIYAVRMKNRNSHGFGKLKDFYVYVSEINPLPLPPPNGNQFTGEICLYHEGVLKPSGIQFLPCQNNKVLRGRYVYVWKPGATGYLLICELEALTRYPLRQFTFTLMEDKQSELEPLQTESLQGATFTQCCVYCMGLTNATLQMMQFDKGNGECSCFEIKPFVDTNLMANMTSHQSYDIIGRQ